jgi:hypothetical protein
MRGATAHLTTLGARLALGGLLLYSRLGKLEDPAAAQGGF